MVDRYDTDVSESHLGLLFLAGIILTVHVGYALAIVLDYYY
jgi:hypothetical protein